MKRFLSCCSVWMVAALAGAQPPPTQPEGTRNIEVDPIRCWWRTGAGAVRIGETFDLWLTCATLENDAVQVIPDESRLGTAVVQMAPFEVLGGAHPADIRSGSRRFFQYQYILRVISPDAIGKDLPLPPTVLHYRVNSRVAGNTAIQGRDLVYVLPPQSIRVESMVPADATDIRDASGVSFSVGERLRFRAGVMNIIAITCVALGVLMSVLVILRLLGGMRRTPADESLMPTRSIVRAVLRELLRVQRAREQAGWNEGLAARALAATRIAAACAIGRPVNQRLADPGGKPPEGRLFLPGAKRGKPLGLSSPVTAADVARASGQPAFADRPHLDDLRDALAALSSAQYGKTTSLSLDEAALDHALSAAIAASTRVKAEHAWLKTLLRQLPFGGAAAESQA